ncbi:MAG: ABC transporter substrate-binding protein [Chloroflexota bacterium]
MLIALLGLAVLVGAFFIWLRSEPEQVTECEPGYRLFEHTEGATCVPEDASKVLTYSTAASQFYVAIDHPMAMTVEVLDHYTAADIPGLYDRLRDVNEDTLDLGRVDGGVAQNVELLLQIQPDVIISEWVVGDLTKTASVVAPVVLLTDLGTWKEVTLMSGDLIGERDTAVALLEAYEQRVQTLRDQFDNPAEITVSHVRLYHERPSIQLPISFAGQIINDVGFSFPPAQLELIEDSPEQLEIDFSDERIDLADGDFIFIYPGFTDYIFSDILSDLETESDELTDEFRNDPLYPFLNAAQEGTVYDVDIHWSMTGIYSAHYVLDDLFRYVAGVDPEVVSPNPLRLE